MNEKSGAEVRIELMTRALHLTDNATAAVRDARESCFTAFSGATGEQYHRLEAALCHLDRARAALRGDHQPHPRPR